MSCIVKSHFPSGGNTVLVTVGIWDLPGGCKRVEATPNPRASWPQGWVHCCDAAEFPQEEVCFTVNETLQLELRSLLETGLIDFVSLVAQTVKNLSAMWQTRVRPLGQEDPLEKGMATHSSILAWRIPWTEEPGGLQSMGLQRVSHDWVTNISFHYWSELLP